MARYRVVYEDGVELDDVRYDLIDRVRLRKFIVYNKEGFPSLTIHLNPPQRLVYRERVEATQGGGVVERVTLVGWQETRNGVNFQCIFAVFDDGHIEAVNGFRRDMKWFYPVKFRAEE